MTSMEHISGDTPQKLYDWNVPLTDDERQELLDNLAREADQEAEDNHPASRPSLPASHTAARMVRKRIKHRRTHSHD